LHIGAISLDTAIRLNALWHSRLPVVIKSNAQRVRNLACFAAEHENRYYASAIWTDPIAGILLTKGERWIELRRYAIADDAPKNTASRMLSIMVRMIRKKMPEIVRCISYQDTDAHEGTIYKASGWIAGKVVSDTNWGLRSSEHGRKRNPVVAPGIKVRWELPL
jgi:hypothetical protein